MHSCWIRTENPFLFFYYYFLFLCRVKNNWHISCIRPQKSLSLECPVKSLMIYGQWSQKIRLKRANLIFDISWKSNVLTTNDHCLKHLFRISQLLSYTHLTVMVLWCLKNIVNCWWEWCHFNVHAPAFKTEGEIPLKGTPCFPKRFIKVNSHDWKYKSWR